MTSLKPPILHTLSHFIFLLTHPSLAGGSGSPPGRPSEAHDAKNTSQLNKLSLGGNYVSGKMVILVLFVLLLWVCFWPTMAPRPL